MSGAAPALTPDQERLLRDAGAWRLIGLLFECPVGDWGRQIEALAAETDDPDLREAAALAQTQASEGLYHAIFGPGGPVSPREVTYLGGVQLGYLLAELDAYYTAFAYQPHTQEPHDHVSVEANFMAYLRMKQAYALASGDADGAAISADAAAGFRAEHLSLMAQPIGEALRAGSVPYLAAAGRALLLRAGAPPRVPLPMAPGGADVDPDAEIECG